MHQNSQWIRVMFATEIMPGASASLVPESDGVLVLTEPTVEKMCRRRRHCRLSPECRQAFERQCVVCKAVIYQSDERTNRLRITWQG